MSNTQGPNTLSELFARFPLRSDSRALCAGPVLIGHRGASLEYPENTVPAFARALALGANIIELDVRLSRDGHIVVIHDPTVDRTMQGSGPVSTFTLAQLRAMPLKLPQGAAKDAGSARIATLREVFQAFPEAIIAVEIKDNSYEICRKVVDLIRRFGRVDRTFMVLISLRAGLAKIVRKLEPALVTGHTRNESIRFTAMNKLKVSRLFKARGAAFEVPLKRGRINVVTRGYVRAAHRKGIRVFVWTINDPVTIARLYRMGVDGIFTDDLAIARSTVEKIRSFGR